MTTSTPKATAARKRRKPREWTIKQKTTLLQEATDAVYHAERLLQKLADDGGAILAHWGRLNKYHQTLLEMSSGMSSMYIELAEIEEDYHDSPRAEWGLEAARREAAGETSADRPASVVSAEEEGGAS